MRRRCERTEKRVSDFIEDSIPVVPDHLDLEVTPSVGLQYAIQRSVFNAQSSERNFVAGPHVLIALFAVEDCHAAYFLEEAGVMRIELMEDVSHSISDEDDSVELEDEESGDVAEEGERSKNPLKQFCTLLNEEARAGRIDPIVGRADEIARCIHILSRRRKNNPVLVGEAGVGKTAIAEGLAKAIEEGKVPAPIAKRQNIFTRRRQSDCGYTVSRRF